MERQTTLSYELASARAETDRLFTLFDPAAFYDRPIAERHRIIFYLGHLEAFDWNQLKQTGMAAHSPEPAFDHLFAFGIDPPPGRLPADMPSDWPSVAAVRNYNKGVREIVDREIEHAPEDIQQMMIEHRHMHAETFAYILHNLDQAKKKGPVDDNQLTDPARAELLAIPAGKATLGRRAGDGFGWDNEFNQFSVDVPPFSVGKYKVTNREYLEFVREGGPVPHYWFERCGQWFYRGMFRDMPLPPDWPVYATWEQANSYAGWRGLALPTEAQYHRAACGAPEGENLHGNLDYRGWDPVAVNATPEDDSAFRVAQTTGNGWEWTSTLFAPFEGFTPRPTYAGYSADFFDNQHYVMKGASPRTSRKLARRSFRNWFRPEYPYVYATFRVVQN